jgi:hypothetical protein
VTAPLLAADIAVRFSDFQASLHLRKTLFEAHNKAQSRPRWLIDFVVSILLAVNFTCQFAEQYVAAPAIRFRLSVIGRWFHRLPVAFSKK